MERISTSVDFMFTGRNLYNQNRELCTNRLKNVGFHSVLVSCKIAKRENVVLRSGLSKPNLS